jgi:hypothetical protein
MKIKSYFYGYWAFNIDVNGIPQDPISVKTVFPQGVNFEIVKQPDGILSNQDLDYYKKNCEKTGNYLNLVNI